MVLYAVLLLSLLSWADTPLPFPPLSLFLCLTPSRSFASVFLSPSSCYSCLLVLFLSSLLFLRSVSLLLTLSLSLSFALPLFFFLTLPDLGGIMQH